MLDASYEALLGVVADVRSKDWVNGSHISIPTDHLHTKFASIYKRFENKGERVMKDTLDSQASPRFLLDMQQLVVREISKKDSGMFRGLSSYPFGHVGNGVL